MPTPDGNATVEITPIWSENAGRSASGLYIGDIVAEKRKAVFTFTGLTDEHIRLIKSQIKKYYTADFVNPDNPTERITMECYKPPMTVTLKQISGGVSHFDKFVLSLIER
jgi:hypothetical protein